MIQICKQYTNSRKSLKFSEKLGNKCPYPLKRRMDRDPLALPGDADYKSGPDSDVEEIINNGDRTLTVELVPADMSYVQKITGNKRGRKKKEVKESTSDTGLNVQLIGPITDEIEETDSDDEVCVKVDGRSTNIKKRGRPRKKKKAVENYFKPNPASTHHSRRSRYEQIQEKKDEFLQQELERKAVVKEKYRKHIERAKEKYREKKAAEEQKASEEKAEKILFPFQKKLHRKICMLANKIRHVDKSKSKDELVKEMALEWKTDRQKFWENYKRRWKEVASRSVKPMTEERAEFLRKRGQKYDKLKQEQTMMVNRVSTRNRNKRESKEDALDSPSGSMMGYQGESYDGIDEEDSSMINYDVYLDEEFVAEEESFQEMDNNESFLTVMSQGTDETLSQQEVDYESHFLDEYQTNINDIDEVPSYYDEVVDTEDFLTHEIDMSQLNGFS